MVVTKEQRTHVVACLMANATSRLSATVSLIRGIRGSVILDDCGVFLTTDDVQAIKAALTQSENELSRALENLTSVRFTANFSPDNGTLRKFYSLMDSVSKVLADTQIFDRPRLLAHVRDHILTEITTIVGMVRMYIDYAEGKSLAAVEYSMAEEHFLDFVGLHEPEFDIECDGGNNVSKGLAHILLMKRKIREVFASDTPINNVNVLVDIDAGLDDAMDALVLGGRS